MANTKNSIDYSDFVSPNEANKLTADSIRKTFEYDSYGGKNAFIALVLNNPVPVGAIDASLEVGAASPRIADTISEFTGLQATAQHIGKIVFRARILGPNSPHAFIPNPCGSKEFAQETLKEEFDEVRMKLISMHTAFYTTEDFAQSSGRRPPVAGEYVEVFLDRGSAGAFDLQQGRFEGTIVNIRDARQQLANLDIPWALQGGGPQYAFNSRGPGKGTPLPSWALNQVGMPFKGDFKVTSPWGPPGSSRSLPRRIPPSVPRRHGGIDFGTPSGTEILAIAPGTVQHAGLGKSGPLGGYGGFVVIKHKNRDYEQDSGKPVYSVYAHLQSWKVSAGSSVEAGAVIGISGGGLNDPNRGGTTGPHLHLEVWVGINKSPPGIPYGQGPPVVEGQNSTMGYSVDFWEWYTDNARKLGVSGVPVRNNEEPPTQAEGGGTNAGMTDVVLESSRTETPTGTATSAGAAVAAAYSGGS
jgi:murein DD-endopeptidase MepM/ murein hydrolase activator NlpD